MPKSYLAPFFDPRTGRRVLEKGHVYVGDANDIETPSEITPDIIPLGEGNILVGNADNVAEESLALKDLISRLLNLRYELSFIEENATFILQKVHPLLPKAQALNQLPNGILKHKNGIVQIATLNQGQVYVGDANNEPISTQTISRDNLPDLTWTRIWRGNLLGRPVESDDLTTLEAQVEAIQTQIAAIEEAILALQNWQVAAEAQIEELISEQLIQQQEIAQIQIQLGEIQAAILELQTAVTTMQAEITAIQTELLAIQAELAALGAAIAGIQSELTALGATVAGLSASLAFMGLTVAGLGLSVAGLQSSVSSLQSQINNLTVTMVGDVVGTGLLSSPIITVFTKKLNEIPNAGDVNVANFALINVKPPLNPQDAANKAYVDSRIIPGGITAVTGFVEGVNPIAGVLTTTRGATCLLTNIPAGGDVDMAGFSVKNLKETPDEDYDAVNSLFVWRLLHDEVGVQWS